MEFSKALREGAIQIPKELFIILDEVFSVKNPLASGLAVARNLSIKEIEELIKARNYMFHDTKYLLVDNPEAPKNILWMQTVYVYTENDLVLKNLVRPTIIDPMPCRRLYGDPIALDELVICMSLRPLIGRELVLKTFFFSTRKKIIDIDVEGLCKGITSYARRNGGVPVYLPVILRRRLDDVVRALKSKSLEPELLRSSDIGPLRDLIDSFISESLRVVQSVQS